MSEPVPAPERPQDWWTRPKVVLPFVGAVALLVALLTPEPSLGRFGDGRLSSHLTGSLGAAALARTAGRFGFQVVARDTSPGPDTTEAPGTTIHAVLAPPIPLTPLEAHEYLERVRAGDGLLFVHAPRNALSDSLGVAATSGGATLYVAPADSAACGRRRDVAGSLWPDGRAHLVGVLWRRGIPAGKVAFALRADPAAPGAARYADAAAGIPYGLGRIVVVADPDLLRNDVLRHCSWGADVVAMRMLEWLSAGGPRPRRALVFDEFHQGYGHPPSVTGLVGSFLVDHPVGRSILALVLSGLILLLAVAPRPLPPRDRETIERRDPLEQVDALAQAYEQVGASRTATTRLVRVLRLRVEGAAGAGRSRTDEDFLTDAARNDPSLAMDVALVTRALREPLAARELPPVAAALRRIEDSFLTTHA